MTLASLMMVDVRNFKSVQLSSLASVNVITGDNGSGKTSILESIHLLGLARSFRSSKIRSYVRYGKTDCTVQGDVILGDCSVSIGITKSLEMGDRILINQGKVRSVTELASLLPVQLITPDTLKLLEDGPVFRRKFIDWGVFHVEPQFIYVWKKLQKILKQRNTLLKQQRPDRFLLRSWNKELEINSRLIDSYREKYIDCFTPIFREVMDRLSPNMEVSLDYFRGWNKKYDYLEVLESSLDQDVAVGYTRFGPHRADIKLKVHGMKASDILSRGQEKIVVVALKLAQGMLFNHVSLRPCIYLVDDLASELDYHHQRKLMKALLDNSCQLFLTSIYWPDKLITEAGSDYSDKLSSLKRFHVEHGDITPEN